MLSPSKGSLEAYTTIRYKDILIKYISTEDLAGDVLGNSKSILIPCYGYHGLQTGIVYPIQMGSVTPVTPFAHL